MKTPTLAAQKYIIDWNILTTKLLGSTDTGSLNIFHCYFLASSCLYKIKLRNSITNFIPR